MSCAHTIEADLTWTGSRFEPGVCITVAADGRIEAVGRATRECDRRFKQCAILPGMVNVHSHAFQRGLRGFGERFPSSSRGSEDSGGAGGAGGGSFWSWREAMYHLVERLDEQLVYQWSVRAFREMLAAGITTVGEFHYIHHAGDEADYRLDDVVLRAASDAGIRIALLNTYYRTGGIGEPLSAAQRRFRSESTKSFWAQLDQLSSRLDEAMQSLGVVAHSIRAADIDDISALGAEAARRDLVFHMHIEEQLKEIEACVHHYGKRPMQLINERVEVDGRFTAVHCTHTHPDDMAAFLERGGNVCICPLTEASLGDGIADVPQIRQRDGAICLGTDSNARISFNEEMRWLEYVQRLAHERRGVCVDDEGSNARCLWEIATINGAWSLGLDVGRIAVHCPADLIVIDLEHPTLASWTDDTLLDAFVFGSGAEAMTSVCVNGVWRETQQLQRK